MEWPSSGPPTFGLGTGLGIGLWALCPSTGVSQKRCAGDTAVNETGTVCCSYGAYILVGERQYVDVRSLHRVTRVGSKQDDWRVTRGNRCRQSGQEELPAHVTCEAGLGRRILAEEQQM